jgi:hypothetical protein
MYGMKQKNKKKMYKGGKTTKGSGKKKTYGNGMASKKRYGVREADKSLV